MIKNITRKTILSHKFQLYSRWWQHAIGLMFSKPRCIVFQFKTEKMFSLHMFFVFFPIDVVFLDQEKMVIEFKENFRPWTTYHGKNAAKYIIEAPQNCIQNSKTKIGDSIRFK